MLAQGLHGRASASEDAEPVSFYLQSKQQAQNRPSSRVEQAQLQARVQAAQAREGQSCWSSFCDSLGKPFKRRDDDEDSSSEDSDDESSFPSMLRLKFLMKWCRFELVRLDLKSGLHEDDVNEARRHLLFQAISAAYPWARKVECDVDLTSCQHLTTVVHFLNKPHIAKWVKAANALSRDQVAIFKERKEQHKQIPSEILLIWQSRVLPTLAAIQYLSRLAAKLSLEVPNKDCLALAAQSAEIMQKDKSEKSRMRSKSIVDGFMMRARRTLTAGTSSTSLGRGLRRTSVRRSSSSKMLLDGEDEDSDDGSFISLPSLPPDDVEFEMDLDSDPETSNEGRARRRSLDFIPIADWSLQKDMAIHGWTQADATQMKVRGAAYLKDKKKELSEEALFETVLVDVVDSCGTEGFPHSAAHPLSAVNALRRAGDKRYLVVVNFCMPPLHVIAVFAARGAQEGQLFPPEVQGRPAHELMRRFIQEMSDDQRKKRFKVIPAVKEGPWLVKRGMPSTPGIIGKSLKVNFFEEKGSHFEISVDIFSSSAAQRILGLAKGAGKALAMEIYYVIEGQSEEELPEQIMGGFGIIHVDLNRARGPI